MLNSTMIKLKELYKDRIFAINIDNNKTVFVGYNDHYNINDIDFQTIADSEVVKVHTTVNCAGKELHYSTYHSSDCVQWVGVMDANSNQYRPNPIEFK